MTLLEQIPLNIWLKKKKNKNSQATQKSKGCSYSSLGEKPVSCHFFFFFFKVATKGKEDKTMCVCRGGWSEESY